MLLGIICLLWTRHFFSKSREAGTSTTVVGLLTLNMPLPKHVFQVNDVCDPKELFELLLECLGHFFVCNYRTPQWYMDRG